MKCRAVSRNMFALAAARRGHDGASAAKYTKTEKPAIGVETSMGIL